MAAWPMYLLTVFVYPTVLALLCAGTGLLVDRACRPGLRGALIPLAGMAALIGITQLTVWISFIAPASPALVAIVAASGFVICRRRAGELLHALRTKAAAGPLCLGALVYLIGIAPVMIAGRASFSSYMTLTDSAVHMIGADYLITHGASFAHLDLHNSYGLLIKDYFDSGYPSGADTIFGASAFLLGLPTIWAFQPFNAFALALAVGPAWLLVRRCGLSGLFAGLAALTVSLPALVYAYELIASVKEILAMSMLLGIGALVTTHRKWLAGSLRSGLPFALLAAAGISALGVGFGAWVLMSLIVLLCVRLEDIREARRHAGEACALLGGMALTVAIFALPTWAHAEGSFSVSQAIATTSNAGNLQRPLHTMQVVGDWLTGSYLSKPEGLTGTLTGLFVAITVLAAAIGALHLLRGRRFALAGWLGGCIVLWLALKAYGTTWVNAKALVLTSPIIVLSAWTGVQALRNSSEADAGRLGLAGLLAGVAAVAIAGGILLSDAIQYHDLPLAPTARYDEMASLNARFAGKGPALFTDFDEYAMYELRSLDIGGPDFLDPPPALTETSEGHSYSVDLELAKPATLTHYPLVITRVNPLPYRPPAAYRLLWQGTYYQVWGRVEGARPAIRAVKLHGAKPASCGLIAGLARLARRDSAMLIADSHPQVVSVSLAHVAHTDGWRHAGIEMRMNGQGRLWSAFRVAHAGLYRLWLEGEAMPTLNVRVDGRELASVGAQMSGNGFSPDPMVPIRLRLSAGRHDISIARGGFSLAPGSGGEAYLEAVFLTPAGWSGGQHLETVPPARWRSLCGAHIDWVEVVPRTGHSGRRRQPLRRQRSSRDLTALGAREVSGQRLDLRVRVDERTQVGDRDQQPDRGADLKIGGIWRLSAKDSGSHPLLDPIEVTGQGVQV
jgi:hypothetical protein